MSRRILLHVGTPKTGTSYLQDVLFGNRKRLKEAGILYPADRFDAHFLAALDLMGLTWGGLENEAVGAWNRLATLVRQYDGTAIISHEILATASRAQVHRALESLGDAEVHLILSVRDLMRQIPAEWQENVKHRATLTYAQFLERLQDPDRASRIGSWFWGVQEIPDILDRWGAGIPPERVHLVTVPPAGGPPEVLWQRFSRTFGLDKVDLDLHTERSNPSLGVPETALVRMINASVNTELPPSEYRPLVRELLAHQTLSRRTSSPRLAVPPDLVPWVRGLEDAWIDDLAGRGYDVVGDLGELRGVVPDEAAWVDPDEVRGRQVTDASLAAIKALLLDSAAMSTELDRVRGELHETRAALERSYLRPTYRLREKVVRRLDTSQPGRTMLRVYRAARGRNSRSA